MGTVQGPWNRDLSREIGFERKQAVIYLFKFDKLKTCLFFNIVTVAENDMLLSKTNDSGTDKCQIEYSETVIIEYERQNK